MKTINTIVSLGALSLAGIAYSAEPASEITINNELGQSSLVGWGEKFAEAYSSSQSEAGLFVNQPELPTMEMSEQESGPTEVAGDSQEMETPTGGESTTEQMPSLAEGIYTQETVSVDSVSAIAALVK